MPKTLTIFLATTPYGYQNSQTALRLAEAALEKGHRVVLFASADAVHNFTGGQKPKGVPNAEEGFSRLIDKGLQVELCGTCLNFRGIGRESLLDGAAPSSLRTLFGIVGESDALVSLGA
ncbi:MAG: DsrE family protein [Dehalococcoidales bacterium]|nr:DsrE family protein [Dehalococcoidales bacterium]